ncbi:MAG: gliding motility-associated C-terminal domain-containing protein [Cyclobacteriaceae bacterium]
MKKFTLSLLICFVFFKTIEASHIVGGEFELRHIENYQYRLNLIQYFDDVNGNEDAEDQIAIVYIFRKSNDEYVSSVQLNNVGSEFVDYTNPECAIDELSTRKILYTTLIELPPGIYNDPEGYYVVYERCCRNYVTENLQVPDQTGQTFYLEFPPVTKNGEPFVDTTPILFPPLSDYACVNRPFYFDFAGSDPDGDSLSYSLSAPLNSSAFEALPIPKPAPHSPVVFKEGTNVTNMVPGTPALSISQEGLLTVTPSQLGLFVFAIRVEEFRDGEKIGEVRRDFQMLVIDCNPGETPNIEARVKGETEFYQEGTTLQFGLEDEKCLELFVTDADPEEVITVEAIGVNFDQNIQDLISPRLSILNGPNDTLKLDFCLPDCPYVRGPMIIDLIAYDDACSVPLRDTLRLTIEVEGPQNSDPFIVGNPNILNVNLNVGENYELEIQGLDEDEDVLILEAFGDDFDLDDLGIELREQLLVPGEVKKVLTWTPDCEAFDFRAQNEFTVFVELDDESECGLGEPDRLEIRFTINLPDNNRPKITLDGLEETEITVRINEQISFDVIAEDVDSDLLDLRAVGDGFELADYSINFPGNSGIRKISSPFGWRLSCNDIDLAERSTFDIIFLSTDQTGCSDPATDSLRVRVNVLPPNNDAPTVFIRDIEADSVRGAVGAPVVLDVIGTDENESDILTLRLAEVQLNGQPLDLEITSFRFQNARGRGSVSSRFFWVPDCSLLPPDFVEGFFTLVFTVDDDQCFNSKSDTTSIVISVGVLPLEFDEFEPKNAFTPNGDGSGDFFHLNFCNNVTNGCDLPSGTCANSFQRIEIYNRWGRLVYQSGEPNFQWHAQDMPGGAYFYLAHYTREVYKGQVFIHVPAIE